jgi:hypothetical protein
MCSSTAELTTVYSPLEQSDWLCNPMANSRNEKWRHPDPGIDGY